MKRTDKQSTDTAGRIKAMRCERMPPQTCTRIKAQRAYKDVPGKLDAAVATGRVTHVGGEKYRVRAPGKLKSRCRTKSRRPHDEAHRA